MAEATYVAKYTLGGSGDNVIPDGYIKTVEKVWIDSYTIAFTNTNTTIDIAKVPENKKITGITAVIITTAAQTSGTVSIGFSTDSAVDAFLAPTTITHNKTVTTINLWGGGVLMQNLTTAAIPGANTGKGAALIGGALGAVQPTAADESIALNTAIGGAAVSSIASANGASQVTSSR